MCDGLKAHWQAAGVVKVEIEHCKSSSCSATVSTGERLPKGTDSVSPSRSSAIHLERKTHNSVSVNLG